MSVTAPAIHVRACTSLCACECASVLFTQSRYLHPSTFSTLSIRACVSCYKDKRGHTKPTIARFSSLTIRGEAKRVVHRLVGQVKEQRVLVVRCLVLQDLIITREGEGGRVAHKGVEGGRVPALIFCCKMKLTLREPTFSKYGDNGSNFSTKQT